MTRPTYRERRAANRRQAAASHPSALIVWGSTDPWPLHGLGTYVVPGWADMLRHRAALAKSRPAERTKP